MGRSVYEQPGTKVDGILSHQEGFQVSKGKWKRGKGESEKESKKQGDCFIIICQPIYMYILRPTVECS
jgi:hypothetical protein